MSHADQIRTLAQQIQSVANDVEMELNQCDREQRELNVRASKVRNLILDAIAHKDIFEKGAKFINKKSDFIQSVLVSMIQQIPTTVVGDERILKQKENKDAVNEAVKLAWIIIHSLIDHELKQVV